MELNKIYSWRTKIVKMQGKRIIHGVKAENEKGRIMFVSNHDFLSDAYISGTD